MEVGGFDWDEGNREKCQRHGMSVIEVESVFYNLPFLTINSRHGKDEERFQAVGKTRDNRFAFIVFTYRQIKGQNFIRPISARYMHQKEIANYEKQIKK